MLVSGKQTLVAQYFQYYFLYLIENRVVPGVSRCPIKRRTDIFVINASKDLVIAPASFVMIMSNRSKLINP